MPIKRTNFPNMLKSIESPLGRIATYIAGLAAAGLAAYISVYDNPTQPIGLPNDVQSRIEMIDSVSDSLVDLSRFLDFQRREILRTEQDLSALQKEQKALAPLVELNREQIQAILRLEAERTEANAWQERLTGFAFGIAASLLAAICIEIAKLVGRRLAHSIPPDSPPEN